MKATVFHRRLLCIERFQNSNRFAMREVELFVIIFRLPGRGERA